MDGSTLSDPTFVGKPQRRAQIATTTGTTPITTQEPIAHTAAKRASLRPKRLRRIA